MFVHNNSTVIAIDFLGCNIVRRRHLIMKYQVSLGHCLTPLFSIIVPWSSIIHGSTPR